MKRNESISIDDDSLQRINVMKVDPVPDEH